jgi:RecA-family ATPase
VPFYVCLSISIKFGQLDSNTNNSNEYNKSEPLSGDYYREILKEIQYGESYNTENGSNDVESTEIDTNIISAEFKSPNDFANSRYSGLNLFSNTSEEIPKLLEPLFPKKGVISLVGSSDTGKSTLLRQLSISIAFGQEDFLGYKINSTTRNVIYVSTEDDAISVGHTLKKQVIGLFKENHLNIIENLNHIKFIFDSNTDTRNPNNILSQINDDLKNIGADLVIIDAFTDVFTGDLNSSTKVREFLQQFSVMADYHNCLFLILHHTGKRTEKFAASKDNVLGSQAFEAKMRALFELKRVPNDETKRCLVITKGNYLSSSIKKQAKVLTFDEEDLLFHYNGQNILSSQINNSFKTVNPEKQNIIPIIEKLKTEKKSLRQIEKILKSKGYNISKSTVSNYLNEMKKS